MYCFSKNFINTDKSNFIDIYVCIYRITWTRFTLVYTPTIRIRICDLEAKTNLVYLVVWKYGLFYVRIFWHVYRLRLNWWILILWYLSQKCLAWHALNRFYPCSAQFYSYVYLSFLSYWIFNRLFVIAIIIYGFLLANIIK